VENIIRAFYSAYNGKEHNIREGKNMEKIILGTRSYWKAKFKQERHQMIKTALMYICAFFLFNLPVWMFLDWLLRGY
jgi:hypothetical protein